jgi:site-specific recombinase XerD
LFRVSHLSEHLLETKGESCTGVTAEDIDGFWKVYPSRCRHSGPLKDHLYSVRNSVNRFVEYLRQKELFSVQENQPIYQSLLDSYLCWLRDYQHAALGTVELRRNSICRFLDWLGAKATAEGLSALTAKGVESFVITYANGKGKSARRSMQAALRTFLRFCFHAGYIQQHLDRAVPTIRTYKLSTVPRGLSDEQAQKVLSKVDRSTDAGLRDSAILQLLYTFGVRGGQIRALCLEDINWAENQILFRASKNGKDSLLPLTTQVGESLLEYLQKARPTSSYPQVFLTARAPYHPLPESSTISEIVRRRIRAAGIDLPSMGAHTFRHCFATRMVHLGHSLKAVADVLGHRHLATTFIYTKVDFNALRQVALEWPQEV